MSLLIVKFPEENWRKVNVSRFLRKFRNIDFSKVVEVPDDKIDRVLEVLEKNNCGVKIVDPKHDDIETKILKRIVVKASEIRLGSAEPKDLESIATDAIVKFSLENLSDEVSEILHDCIDFAETPLLSDLKEIEQRAQDVLNEKYKNALA